MVALSIDDLDYLDPEERAECERLIEDRGKPSSLAHFIADRFPHEPPPYHIGPLIEIIERARHERIKVCISWPPRHAKTVTILRGIVWWLINEPADVCAYYSYSDRQGWSKSAVCRQWARECGIAMGSKQNVGEWENDSGGGLRAGGLKSGLTGHGVSGLFVVDDPFKNRAEADSIVNRERVWDNFREVVFTRLEGASVIVVHTRWHEDDLIGRLADRDGWEVVNFPAVAEKEDTLGRSVGDALWPEKFNEEELGDIKAELGDWSFAALYQGRPAPKGSRLFREPARFELPKTSDEWRVFLEGKFLVIGVDPAASTRTVADYSAACLMAKDSLGPSGRAWILRVLRKQSTIPDFVSDLRDMQAHWKCLLAVEAVGGFKAVPQMLKHLDQSLRIVEITPTTDKFMRAQPVAAAWNAGNVLVPVGEDWVDPFLLEVTKFSGVKDPTDDQVDAMAHAWNSLAVTAPRRTRGSRISTGAFG